MSYPSFYTKFNKLVLVCAVFGAFFSASALSAQAQTTTFAQFLQNPAGQNFVFTNNTPIASATFNTTSGGVPIRFFYSNIVGLNPVLDDTQNARLFITATTTTTPATLNAGTLTQPLDQVITISIIRNTAAPVGVGTGTRTNLLTAVISTNTGSPAITGGNGGTSGTFGATTPNNVVTFTSDFLNFASTTQRDLSLSFSSVQTALALGPNNFLQSFTAAGTGTFASNPVPTAINPPTASSVTVGGRVLTPTGRGLRNALVTLTEADGTTRTVLTGVNGSYNFPDLTIPQTIVVSVRSKSYRFLPRVFSPDADFNDLDFTALGK
jgi:uncharacterized membrane protein